MGSYNHQASEGVDARWDSLLADLEASGFRQRLFMRQNRNGGRYQVGLPRHRVALYQKGDDYPTDLADRIARAKLEIGMIRTINADPLSPPIEFQPGESALPITPIDACVAIADGDLEPLWREVEDPRPPKERTTLAQSGNYESLRRAWNKGKVPEDAMDRIYEVMDQGGDKLLIQYRPTPEGVRREWQNRTETNSYHSSIVLNDWHSRAVTAYDLAVAKPVLWTETEKKFYKYLCEVADWRIKSKKKDKQPGVEDKLDPLKATGFYEPEDPKNKALIYSTAQYYVNGVPPPQIFQAKTPDKLSLIHYETSGKRAPAAG
jgi:hypothetical protein